VPGARFTDKDNFMTIFGPKIMLRHLVNSQNILRPILQQNIMITFEIYYDISIS